MADFAVGDAVLVNKKYKAVIRYIGTTSFKAGIWYGVELEKEKGKHNGTVYGQRYFDAKPNHGTFVSKDDLTHYDARDEAASAVSSALRMNADRETARRKAIAEASIVLDADEEKLSLQRRQMLQDTLMGEKLNRERPPAASIDQWEREADAMVVEASYTGPHIKWPLTLDQVLAMMAAFKTGHTLHYKYAVQLVSAYRKYATELPTLVEVDVTPGSTLTVVGDTHGQLKDLYGIYTINGIPSTTNRYLVNGDFVDRGDYSCEIVFTLLAFTLLYPGEPRTSRGAGCLLNRGNHEAHNQNMTQGFMSEVLEKYSGFLPTPAAVGGSGGAASTAGGGSAAAGVPIVERGLRMYDLFLCAFDCMPLAHVLRSSDGGKKVFVTHGGLMQSPGVRLAHIAALKRKKEIPYGYPGFEDKLYEDLMWSDPRPMRGTAANSRGAGVYFGPDVTQRFCAGNGISLVVRSHECVQEGYQFMHDGRLVTVFSASHYCGRDTNKGAILVFDSDLNHTIQQYVAGNLESTNPQLRPPVHAVSTAGLIAAGVSRGTTAVAPLVVLAGPELDESTAAAQEDNVRRLIAERVILHKPDLYFFWSQVDSAAGSPHDGRITKLQWAEGMRTVFNLELPWMLLLPSVADVEPDGRVNYTKFLDRYYIDLTSSSGAGGVDHADWQDAIIDRACRTLYSSFGSLEAAYKAFDTDGSGSIEFEEFQRGLESIAGLGLSRPQLVDLMNALDTDKDGRIQLSEFMNRFRVSFSRISSGPSATGTGGAGATPGGSSLDAWTLAALERVGSALFRQPSLGIGPVDPAAVFARIDTNHDGQLSLAEFTRALREDLHLSDLTDGQITAIMGAADSNGNGSLNYAEFVAAFTVRDTRGTASGKGTAAGGADGATAATAGASAAAGGAGGSSPVSLAAGGSGATSTSGGTGGASRSWQRGVIDRVVSTLFAYRLELRAAFNLFDLDGNGVITREEFRSGLRALTSLTGSPITDVQADELLRVLDKDGDGTIDFAEFVDAFRVTDSGRKSTGSAPSSPTAGGSTTAALPAVGGSGASGATGGR